jgi:hypothetical protein
MEKENEKSIISISKRRMKTFKRIKSQLLALDWLLINYNNEANLRCRPSKTDHNTRGTMMGDNVPRRKIQS